MRDMRIEEEIIDCIKKHKPSNEVDLLTRCDLTLKLAGQGGYRNVYTVPGRKFVIKVPIGVESGISVESYQENILHAGEEYDCWMLMNKSRGKYKRFKPFLPDILYYNSKTGVTVVRKYRTIGESDRHKAFLTAMQKDLNSTFDHLDADCHFNNVGLDVDGSYKFLDMGLFLTGVDHA